MAHQLPEDGQFRANCRRYQRLLSVLSYDLRTEICRYCDFGFLFQFGNSPRRGPCQQCGRPCESNFEATMHEVLSESCPPLWLKRNWMGPGASVSRAGCLVYHRHQQLSTTTQRLVICPESHDKRKLIHALYGFYSTDICRNRVLLIRNFEIRMSQEVFGSLGDRSLDIWSLLPKSVVFDSIRLFGEVLGGQGGLPRALQPFPHLPTTMRICSPLPLTGGTKLRIGMLEIASARVVMTNRSDGSSADFLRSADVRSLVVRDGEDLQHLLPKGRSFDVEKLVTCFSGRQIDSLLMSTLSCLPQLSSLYVISPFTVTSRACLFELRRLQHCVKTFRSDDIALIQTLENVVELRLHLDSEAMLEALVALLGHNRVVRLCLRLSDDFCPLGEVSSRNNSLKDLRFETGSNLWLVNVLQVLMFCQDVSSLELPIAPFSGFKPSSLLGWFPRLAHCAFLVRFESQCETFPLFSEWPPFLQKVQSVSVPIQPLPLPQELISAFSGTSSVTFQDPSRSARRDSTKEFVSNVSDLLALIQVDRLTLYSANQCVFLQIAELDQLQASFDGCGLQEFRLFLRMRNRGKGFLLFSRYGTCTNMCDLEGKRRRRGGLN